MPNSMGNDLTLPIRVLIYTQHLSHSLLQSLLLHWPADWQYLRITTRPDISTKTLPSRSLSELQSELRRSAPAHYLLLTDDGVLGYPANRQITDLLGSKVVGLLSPTHLTATQGYGPANSTTPDHFLAGALIPHELLQQFDIPDLLRSQRWLGHRVALRCLELEQTYHLISPAGPLFPVLNQIKGRHIVQTRWLSPTVLDQAARLSDVRLPADWLRQNVQVCKLLAWLNDGITDETEAHQAKQQIDQHLCTLTLCLQTAALDRTQAAPSLQMQPPLALKGKRIAVFKIDSIGDVIVSTPVLEALLAAEPAEISLITTEAIATLYAQDPRWSQVIAFPEERKIALASADITSLLEQDYYRLVPVLSDYDIAIFPRYFPDFSLAHHLVLLLGIPERVGLLNRQPEEGAYFNPLYELNLTRAVEPAHQQHEVKKLLEMSRLLEMTEPKALLSLPPSSPCRSDLLPASFPSRYLVLSLGAMSPNRRWPAARFAEVATELQQRYPDLGLIYLGGKDLADPALPCDSPTSVNLVGKTSLAETARLIEQALLYLGNDSGTLHLAAALGIPVVEISMHPQSAPRWHLNSPDRFGPWGVKHQLLQPADALSDTCRQGCVASQPHCILQIEVQTVIEAAREFLA